MTNWDDGHYHRACFCLWEDNGSPCVLCNRVDRNDMDGCKLDISEEYREGIKLVRHERDFGPLFYSMFGKDWRVKCGYEKHFKLEEVPTWAHLMHKMAFFSSTSEARRNGHKDKVVPGTYIVGKKHKYKVVVED